MIIKEFKRLLVPLAIRIGFTIILSIIIGIFFRDKLSNSSLLKSILFYFTWIFGITLLWISNYLGSSAFHDEHRDNAIEYLLTFPLTKSRILLNKLIPGIVALLSLMLTYVILFYSVVLPIIHQQETIPVSLRLLFTPILLPVWCLFIYLSAFMVGFFDWKEIRLLISFVHLTFFFMTTNEALKVLKLLINTDNAANEFKFFVIGGLIGVLLILVFLGISFLPIYYKFDMKGMTYHKKRFIISGLGVLIVGYAFLKIWNILSSL